MTGIRNTAFRVDGRQHEQNPRIAPSLAADPTENWIGDGSFQCQFSQEHEALQKAELSGMPLQKTTEECEWQAVYIQAHPNRPS